MEKKLGLTTFLLLLGLGAAALCIRGLEAVVLETGAARTWGGGVLLCGLLLIAALWYLWDRVYHPLQDLEELIRRWPEASPEEREVWTAGIGGALGAAAAAFKFRLDETQRELDQTRARLEAVSETQMRRQLAEEICRSALPNLLRDTPAKDAVLLAGLVSTEGRPACTFYDYFSLDEKTLCVIIGEVPGGGIPEALYLVIARTTIRSRLRMGHSLAEALSDVNTQLYNQVGDYSLRAVAGLLDLTSGRLFYVNAGGTNPWLMRNEGRYEPVEQAVYTALGLNEQVTYRAVELRLRQGDHLFFLTSGLGEVSRQSGEQFQHQELRAVLNRSRNQTAPEDLLRFITSELANWCRQDGSRSGFSALSLEYRRGSKDLAHCEVPGVPESASLIQDFLKNQWEANDIQKRHCARLAVLADELFALYCRCGSSQVMTECAVDSNASTVSIRMSAALGGRNPLKWEDDPAGKNAAAFIREHAGTVTFRSVEGRDITTVICFLQ